MPTKTTRKPRPTKKAELNGQLTSPGGEILTLAEAAGFLRVSVEALKTDAINGRVPCRLVGGEWRFSRVALLCWLSHLEPKYDTSEPIGQLISSKEQMRAFIGMWKDDPTVDAMVEEIYRQRKLHTVGGA
jgi:hypothetical protein